MSDLLAIGVDGARGGWIAAACFGESPAEGTTRRTKVSLCATFEAVAALRGGHDVPVAVDVPMGLLDVMGARPCDVQARAILRGRASTVFNPPSRPLLAFASYSEVRACVAQLRQTNPAAKGLSAQAFAIAPKIKEADDFLSSHPGAQEWLYECHPELCFRTLDGRTLDDKKTPHGQADRLRLVEREFADALDVIAQTRLRSRDAQLVDVLDAYAALASALRVAASDHEKIGGELDSAGLMMRMVF